MTNRYIKRPRIPGFDYSGRYAYHVTLNTRGRERVLTGTSAVNVVAAPLSVSAAVEFEVLAYTVMPDHLHALVRGQADHSNLIRLIQRFKQRTSYSHKRVTGESLWQPSFHDHAMRSDDDLIGTARYIVHNPVRAELVQSPGEWPHSGGTLFREKGGAEAPQLRGHGHHR